MRERSTGEKMKNSERLANLARLSMLPYIRDVNITGKEKLDILPKDRPIIFAGTHFFNTDISIIISIIGKEFPIKVVQASTHESPIESLGGYLVYVLGGKNNFLSIKTIKNDKKEVGVFNFDDYKPMIDCLNNGTNLVMAAYYNDDQKYFYDSCTYKEGLILPDKGGVGSIYVAKETNALIVPIAANLDINKGIGISIGDPLEVKKTESDDMSDTKNRTLFFNELRQGSALLMKSLAQMLPQEKRGRW